MANPNGSQSNFRRFLNENKTLAFSLPVLVILIIAVVIIYSGMGKGGAGDASPAVAEASMGGLQGNNVEILPRTERTADDTAADSSAGNGDKAVRNPFNGPMTLTGVLLRDDGNNIAILEGNGKTFIVKKDDVLENNMVVGSIASDKVMLEDNGREIELKLQHASSSQSSAE